ncbi:MAG: alpha/beta hydrolase [Pirellula sp.]
MRESFWNTGMVTAGATGVLFMRDLIVSITAISIWVGMIAASRTVLGEDPNFPRYVDHGNVMQWIDAQGVVHPVRTKQDWSVRRSHILSAMEQVMGNLPGHPRTASLDMQILESEDLPTLTRKKITYLAGPGDRIPAYLLIPKNKAPKSCPAMLCLHGTSGPRGRTAGVGADYPRYTLELAERGYVTIAPDYTLLGDNQIDPELLGYSSGTMKGIWSHIRAVDLLATIAEVDTHRMGTIGVSLGGHNSLFVGVFDERLKVIVTSSGFDSFLDYMNGNPTGWCQKRYMPRIETVYAKDPKQIPFDFPEVLSAIAPRALYIHAPIHDSNFKVDSARRCETAARKVYQLLGANEQMVSVYPIGEHGFPFDQRQLAYEFVDKVLVIQQPKANNH